MYTFNRARSFLQAVIIFTAVQYAPPTLFDDYVYPDWAYVIGWVVVAFPLVFIPGGFIYRLLVDGGIEVVCKHTIKA